MSANKTFSKKQDDPSNENSDVENFEPKSGKLKISSRELKGMITHNPGSKMAVASDATVSKFDGGNRRTSRRIDRIGRPHDGAGNLILRNGKAVRLCDCLRRNCPGCHFPCINCDSGFCGPKCQINRDFIAVQVMTHPEMKVIRKNPYSK